MKWKLAPDMAAKVMTTPAAVLYEEDFVMWTEEMAGLIEARQTDGLDWANLAEEIRDLGRSQKSALSSHLEILLMHLIKWEIQPTLRTRSWRNSVSNARTEIDVLLDNIPGLRTHLMASFQRSYDRAARNALRETHLPPSTRFTRWTVDEVLDPGFLPK